MESEKWKVSKNFMTISILVCMVLYAIVHFYITSTKTYYYKDNIYVKITNINTKPKNKFDILVAGNKNFINCSLVGRQYYKENYYDTKRTYKELESSCVRISVFGATGQEAIEIKKALKDDVTKLVLVHE